MGKRFIFKEDLVFRVSENCSLLLENIWMSLLELGLGAKKRNWKPVLTLGDGGNTAQGPSGWAV